MYFNAFHKIESENILTHANPFPFNGNILKYCIITTENAK